MWQLIGQERAVSLLKRSLQASSVAHAYLFVGPAHAGKMTLALSLAQALNCAAAEPPCGACDSCRKIASLQHADVRVIALNGDASEENRAKISVVQVEEMQHAASLPPFEGNCKVFIVDGAEFFSIGAANRLLKTLEEPAGRVVFILLTADDGLLPATVVSRCQRVELFPVPASRIEDALRTRYGTEAEKARLLARLSHGCPGWAVLATRDESLVQQRAEWLDWLINLASADAEERFTCATQLATQFSQNRGLVYDKLNLWLDWWRDLLLVKVGCQKSATNVDRLEALAALAENLSLARIRGFIDSLRAAAAQLRQNASPRLVLEVLMLDIPEANRYGEVKSAA